MRAASICRRALWSLDACGSRTISAKVLLKDHQIVRPKQPLLRSAGLEDFEAYSEDSCDGAGYDGEDGNRDNRLNQCEAPLGALRCAPVTHFQLFQMIRVSDWPPAVQEVDVWESQTVTQIS